MGDVAWLTGLFTGVAGLVTYLVRWIVRREREISGQWRETALEALAAGKQSLANQARILAMQEHQTEVLRRILEATEWSSGTGRHSGGSPDGSPTSYGYPMTSGRPPDSQPRR